MSLLLNRETIQGLLTMEDAIGLLENAFGELATGTAVMPPRVAVSDLERNGWYAFMPAQLRNMGALGVRQAHYLEANPGTQMPY